MFVCQCKRFGVFLLGFVFDFFFVQHLTTTRTNQMFLLYFESLYLWIDFDRSHIRKKHYRRDSIVWRTVVANIVFILHLSRTINRIQWPHTNTEYHIIIDLFFPSNFSIYPHSFWYNRRHNRDIPRSLIAYSIHVQLIRMVIVLGLWARSATCVRKGFYISSGFYETFNYIQLFARCAV